MTQPLVAIITPVYNGAKYLAETMDSVQAQTYPNVVHVILDNNSSDETPQIIERYRNGRVPLLVYKNETTLPVAENWNAAVAHTPADAVYMRVLCADDTFYPESTTEMVQLAETDAEIGVIGSLHFCDGDVGDFGWPADRTVFDGLEANRMFMLGQGTIMPVQMMFRKSFADRNQPFYRVMPGPYDIYAMMELLERSKFGFVHKPLGFTRAHHADSISANLYGRERAAWTRDSLGYLREFGPKAFGDDYNQHFQRFRRYYVRRIMAWKKRGMAENDINDHLKALADAGYPWSPALVADAMVDWTMIKAGLRKNWTGYPGWE